MTYAMRHAARLASVPRRDGSCLELWAGVTHWEWRVVAHGTTVSFQLSCSEHSWAWMVLSGEPGYGRTTYGGCSDPASEHRGARLVVQPHLLTVELSTSRFWFHFELLAYDMHVLERAILAHELWLATDEVPV